MKLEQWKQFLAENETKNEGREISYSDVRQEYDAILAFLKQDILQKSGGKYVADALEMLANDVRDQLHDPDPYDKENYAYFDRESGTQPNLSEMPRPDGRTRPSQVVPSRSGKEQYYLRQQNRAKGAAMALLDASEEFAQMPSTEPASSVASFVGQQANIIVDAMVALERFIVDSGSDGLEEGAEINESAMIDLAVLGYLWDNLGVPGSLDKFINSTRGVDKKIDDWFKNNMKNPLVRGLYKALMLTGSPGDRYRHDKKWERGEYDDLTKEQIDKVIALVIKESRKKDE